MHDRTSNPSDDPPLYALSRDKLDAPLASLALPTRLRNWLAAKELETVEALVRLDRRALANERNLGRKSLADADDALRAHLGLSWEEARAALETAPLSEDAPAATQDDADPEAPSSDFSEEARALPLSAVELPARMLSFARRLGLETLGALWDCPNATMSAAPNLGRTSIAETRATLRRFFASYAPPAERAPVPPLLAAWKAYVAGLRPSDRMIATRRSALAGEDLTLAELGATLGVTRERVRQLERRVLEDCLERSPLPAALEAHLQRVTNGGVCCLERLAQDAWFEGALEAPRTLAYLVERLTQERWRCWHFRGVTYVASVPLERVEAAWTTLERDLGEGEFPLDEDELRAHVRSFGERVAAGVDALLWSTLEGKLHVEQRGARRVVTGWGSDRRDRALAFLRAAPAPVPIKELHARLGRGALPREVLYLGRGLVGLASHFPDMDAWRRVLLPRCLEALAAAPAERQWTAHELLQAVSAEVELPEWFTKWHLGALLRDAREVRYLGRLRVRLATDEPSAQRLFVDDLLTSTLREAGGPLDEDELTRRFAERSGLPNTLRIHLLRRPFVELAPGRWGLLERDVPGGDDARRDASDVVYRALLSAGEGMTAHEAWQRVARSGEVPAGWSEALLFSLLRHDERFALAPGRRVGLAGWESVRCPTLPERVLAWVEEAGGALEVEVVRQRLGALTGAAPTRNGLGSTALHAGLCFEGGSLRVREGASSDRDEADDTDDTDDTDDAGDADGADGADDADAASDEARDVP